jgi:hypothetical protein
MKNVLFMLGFVLIACSAAPSPSSEESAQAQDALKKGGVGAACNFDEGDPRRGCNKGLFCSDNGHGKTTCQHLLKVGDWCDLSMGSIASRMCADGLSCVRDLTGDPDSGVCQSGNSDCEAEEGGMCLKPAACKAAHGTDSGNFCDGVGTVCCHGD